MVVNLVRLPFANLPYRPPSDPTAGQRPEYDVIFESWSRRSPADMARGLQALLRQSASVVHAFAVTPTEIYDRGGFSRVHAGSAVYVQHWVDAALGHDCPATRGIPVMHFGSEQDFFERFVDSLRGMDEIIQDTAHFVAGGPRSYTTGYSRGEAP